MTSAAPISRETLEFFLSLDIPIFEIFGITECTGIQLLIDYSIIVTATSNNLGVTRINTECTRTSTSYIEYSQRFLFDPLA